MACPAVLGLASWAWLPACVLLTVSSPIFQPQGALNHMHPVCNRTHRACSRVCIACNRNGLHPATVCTSPAAVRILPATVRIWPPRWDLLDEHMLPAMFSSCVKEPNPGCAAVKLALICIGKHVHSICMPCACACACAYAWHVHSTCIATAAPPSSSRSSS